MFLHHIWHAGKHDQIQFFVQVHFRELRADHLTFFLGGGGGGVEDLRKKFSAQPIQ